MPFTVARHSMQMPIPQKGARGSPCTENRHGSLANIIAADTLVPSFTRTALPFTVMKKPSLNAATSRFALPICIRVPSSRVQTIGISSLKKF
jgi:hypothetical protein